MKLVDVGVLWAKIVSNTTEVCSKNLLHSFIDCLADSSVVGTFLCKCLVSNLNDSTKPVKWHLVLYDLYVSLLGLVLGDVVGNVFAISVV
jgi:hypothetical protein